MTNNDELRKEIQALTATNARLEERIANLVDAIKGEDGLMFRMGKMEGRVSALENWRYYLVGASAAVGAIVSYALRFVK